MDNEHLAVKGNQDSALFVSKSTLRMDRSNDEQMAVVWEE